MNSLTFLSFLTTPNFFIKMFGLINWVLSRSSMTCSSKSQ